MRTLQIKIFGSYKTDNESINFLQGEVNKFLKSKNTSNIKSVEFKQLGKYSCTAVVLYYEP